MIEVDLKVENLDKVLIMISREIEILFRMMRMQNNFYTIKMIDILIPEGAEKDVTKLEYICIVTDYFELDLNTILTHPEWY